MVPFRPLLILVFLQIGEYEETIGTCLVFKEEGELVMCHTQFVCQEVSSSISLISSRFCYISRINCPHARVFHLFTWFLYFVFNLSVYVTWFLYMC
jgi:hypothetical protein